MYHFNHTNYYVFNVNLRTSVSEIYSLVSAT